MSKLIFKQSGQNSICFRCLDKGHRPSVCPSLKPSLNSATGGGSRGIKARNQRNRKKPTTANNDQQTNRREQSPMEFGNEPGSVSPGKAQNLVRLLTGIRDHLSKSQSTRAIYLAMAKEYFESLPSATQQESKIPDDQDYKDFIDCNWPKIKTFISTGRKRKVRWGYVCKGYESPHTIHILSDIVVSAEKAAAINRVATNMELQSYNLIIIVIIFHGLAHAFTKLWFKDAVTQLDVGVGSSGSGESKWLVEERIMGGRLLAEWDTPENAFNMDLIDRVLLRSNAGDMIFSAEIARDVLSSLRCSVFCPPSKDKMAATTQPPNDSIRAIIN